MDVAERVARTLALRPLAGPLIEFLSAGDGRLRAGLLVTLDSSPLEEALGLFEPVVPLRMRPVLCDEGPEDGKAVAEL